MYALKENRHRWR